MSPQAGRRPAALEFGRRWLPLVSRSFAPAIRLLTETLEVSVGLAYLLCRVVDTVEDTPGLTTAQRLELIRGFRSALGSDLEVAAFASSAAATFADLEGAEARLMSETSVLWAHFHHALDESERTVLAHWIDEMAAGMAAFVAREGNGLVVLADEAELCRYCYFVAGTVGGLLTNLFERAEGIEPALGSSLRNRAVAFGLGLQMVNIAKDVAKDHLRGWQFLPRSYCDGFAPSELLSPDNRTRALLAHGALCDLAERHLASGLDYTLLLPATSSARRFCAFPLLLARGTLNAARGNPDVFDPAATVKMARAETMRVLEFVAQRVHDDDAMRALYASFSTT